MYGVYVELEDGSVLRVANNLSAERAEALQEDMTYSGEWDDAAVIWVDSTPDELLEEF